MSGDGFKRAWKSEPFNPFRLHFGSGEHVDVIHPENVAISTGGRTALVFQPQVSDEWFEICDLILVERITFIEDASANGANGAPS